MYQASIRDKKKHKQFNSERSDNYIINSECEEYAYVKKLLGNCRLLVITSSGLDVIGVIRGSLRKFNKRVIIEAGDIVVVSTRDFQNSKVDIVHKYNAEQVKSLITEEKLSNILANYYNKTTMDSKDEEQSKVEDSYITFEDMSDYDSSSDSSSGGLE